VLWRIERGVRRFAPHLTVAGSRAKREFRSFSADENLDAELRLVVEEAYDSPSRKLPGLDIGRAYWGPRTAFPYGGDVVDVFHYANGRTSIALIDISGHGIRSARHAGLVRHALRAYTSQGYDAVGAIRGLNRLCIEASDFEDDSEFFATAFFAVIDADRRSMAYVSAGHEAACLISRGGHRFLDATGPLLGLLDDDRAFRGETLALELGDIVAAVTDGFTEARNEQLEFLGPAPLATVIEHNRSRSAEEQAQAIVARALEYAGARLADDVAAVVLHVEAAENE
jgi:sigma-B regulation protein RsbU (phosphoserine phosphatase)